MKLLNIKKSENIIENSNDGSYLPVDGTYEVAAGIKVTAKNIKLEPIQALLSQLDNTPN